MQKENQGTLTVVLGWAKASYSLRAHFGANIYTPSSPETYKVRFHLGNSSNLTQNVGYHTTLASLPKYIRILFWIQDGIR
jgi:hypothetical protein